MGVSLDNIVILIIGIVLLYVVIKLIKGLIKFLIIMILLLTVGVSAYNIFISKKSFSYEVNRYKVDFQYFKDVNGISKEAVDRVEEIKEGKDVDENITKLIELRDEAKGLNHSEEINGVSSKYINALDTAILVGNGYKAKENVEKLDSVIRTLNPNLKEFIFPELKK